MATLDFLVRESDAEYREKAKAFLTSHQLADFRKCPLLYWHKVQGLVTDEDRPAYLLGRAAHVLILEGRERFDAEYAVGGPINARTGKPFGANTQAYADWAAAQGKPVITDEAVFGETLDFQRDATLRDFRAGRLKYLVNVNVLTTGFDAPNIDCVAMLRPTMSPGLYYQMVGRGFRLCEGKKDCLVIDFGGNVLRHGPVDAIRIENGKSSGPAPAKECPQCRSLIASGYSVCPDCGYEFFKRDDERRAKHAGTADSTGILSGDVTIETYPVQEVVYGVHVKRGAPPDAPRSMRVEYRIGFSRWQSEWICFEHTGYARHKAEAWWRRRSDLPVPSSAEDAVYLAQRGALAPTKSITVRHVSGEEFDRIVGYELGEKPAYREPGWDDDAGAGETVASTAVPTGRQVDDADDIPF